MTTKNHTYPKHWTNKCSIHKTRTFFLKIKKHFKDMSPAFCICENKSAGQLHGNRAADQHLSFLNIDSTIPIIPESEISSL